MADRPIKFNPSGKYNLNFIDPTNDICSYYSGMTQLEDLIQKYFETVFYKPKPNLTLCQTIKYSQKQQKVQTCKYDECSVCLQKFKTGQQIKILPCKHSFHKNCVMPWFQKHSKCPNCRFNLAPSEQNHNNQEGFSD